MHMCHSQSKYGQLPKQCLILSEPIYTCYRVSVLAIYISNSSSSTVPSLINGNPIKTLDVSSILTKLYFAFAKTDGRGSSAQRAGDQYFTFLCSIDLRCNVRGSFQFLIKVDNALFWARPTYPGFLLNLVTQEHKLGIIIIFFHWN